MLRIVGLEPVGLDTHHQVCGRQMLSTQFLGTRAPHRKRPLPAIPAAVTGGPKEREAMMLLRSEISRSRSRHGTPRSSSARRMVTTPNLSRIRRGSPRLTSSGRSEECCRYSRSIRQAFGARRSQRQRVPLEFGKEALATLLEAGVVRFAGRGERFLDAGNRQQRGDARHAELGERQAQLHCGPNPAELAGRVTDDRRWSEEILLEEMVEEVLQAGRDAVVVFAADDRERIDLAVEPSQRFEDRERYPVDIPCT